MSKKLKISELTMLASFSGPAVIALVMSRSSRFGKARDPHALINASFLPDELKREYDAILRENTAALQSG